MSEKIWDGGGLFSKRIPLVSFFFVCLFLCSFLAQRLSIESITITQKQNNITRCPQFQYMVYSNNLYTCCYPFFSLSVISKSVLQNIMFIYPFNDKMCQFFNKKNIKNFCLYLQSAFMLKCVIVAVMTSILKI